MDATDRFAHGNGGHLRICEVFLKAIARKCFFNALNHKLYEKKIRLQVSSLI
jgi:hypothetical protein